MVLAPNDYAETYIASLICNPHTKVFLTKEQKEQNSLCTYVLMSKKRVAVERSYVTLTLKFFRQKNKRAKFFMYLYTFV